MDFLDTNELHYKGMSTEDNFVDYIISILLKIEKFNNELSVMKVKIWIDGLIVREIIKLIIELSIFLLIIMLYKILSLDFKLFKFFINPTILISSFIIVIYSLLEVLQFIRDHYNNLVKDLHYD